MPDVRAVHDFAHRGTPDPSESCGFHHTGRCGHLTGEGLPKCHDGCGRPVAPQHLAEAEQQRGEPVCGTCMAKNKESWDKDEWDG